MDLELFWTEFAESELQRIFKYYNDIASYRVAYKIVNEILDEPEILKTHPEIGQLEELLAGKVEGFRYLVYRNHHKIIYWVNSEENRIEIVDVFDVRQYPEKIKRTI
ncbi:type II toxin-antitoxin system RelE/ParE family toxin [Cryomorpha ignava]|uniref:Type II toxin-antitoxin system RelE/ParE family toxin n=1 Tax=Cryomorpha ignava TaxID=101383 RepID=A0A7K3WTL8_9FLAO|nr:type II toxin-antitoxin system RelE/ParE family toxin [Cryomorpha ignava]NEN24005.1 type II toxin-antitoxin system RelE/ParE family toxin [Cryomorpha ignava]